MFRRCFFTGASLRRSAPEAGAKTTKDLDVLPEFSAAALADRQEGEDQVHSSRARVRRRVDGARTAALVLASRIETFCAPDHPGDVLVETYGASVRSWVLEPSEDGVVVAVVEARYPLPDPRTDGETGRFLTAGLLYRAWVRAILRRDFTPSVVIPASCRPLGIRSTVSDLRTPSGLGEPDVPPMRTASVARLFDQDACFPCRHGTFC